MNSQKIIDWIIDRTPLKRVSCCMYLCIWINEKLSFKIYPAELLNVHYAILNGFSAISFLSQIIGISPRSASCPPPEYTVKQLSLWRQHRGRKKKTLGAQAVNQNV